MISGNNPAAVPFAPLFLGSSRRPSQTSYNSLKMELDFSFDNTADAFHKAARFVVLLAHPYNVF